MDMAHGLRCLVLAALASAALPSAASSLVLDPDPVADLTYAGIAYAAAPLADGAVVVAGDLDRFGTVRALRVGRLRPDGSGDPGFQVDCAFLYTGGRAPCAVRSLLALDDGAVVIAGWIGEVDGAPRQGIARLRADGRLDPAWAPALPDAEQATVLARHATWLLATDRSQRLHRIGLAPPGTVDPAFAPDFGVVKAAVDVRGRVFVGANLQQQVARLDAVDGSVDPDWDHGAANPLSLHIAYDAGTDRLFAVSGDGGFPNRYRVVRLDPQRSPGFEPAWTTHVAGGGTPQPVRFAWIRSLLARDGRVVVSGVASDERFSTTWTFDAGTGALLARTPEGGVDGFQALAIDGAGRVLAAVETADFVDTLAPGGSSLVRLDSTLRIDATFAARTRHTGDVRGAASRPDGSFAIIGEFSRVGDVPRDGLARFDASLRLLPDWRAPAAIAGEQGFVRGTGLVVTDALLDEAGRLLIAGYASNLGIDYEYAIYRLDATTGIAGVPWASFRSATYDGPLVLAPAPGHGAMFVGGSGLRRLCGALADSVVRLRTDGPCSPDPSFGLSADGQVDALDLAADGRLYVSGTFQRIAGNDLPRLARASAVDGRIDGAWRPAPATLPADARFAFAVGPGAIYVGGPLASVAGEAVRGLAWIGIGAAIPDLAWRPIDGDAEEPALAIGSDGAVLAAWYNAPDASGLPGGRVLARLPGQPPARVEAVIRTPAYGYGERILPLGGGRFLWTGGFSSVDGASRTGMALLREGAAAATFGDGFEATPLPGP